MRSTAPELSKCLGRSRCGAAPFKGLKIRGGDESRSVGQKLKTGSAEDSQAVMICDVKTFEAKIVLYIQGFRTL